MNITRLINILTSQLSKNLTLVSAGNTLAAGLGFLSVLIISRTLSVSDFGLFNIALSIMLIAPYLATLGMDTSMMKFTSYYLGKAQSAEAVEVIRTTLYVRLLIGCLITAIIFLTADFLSSRVFNYRDLAILIKLSAFGVFSISVFNYFKSVLYAYRLFKQCVVLQLLVDLAKLATVSILMLSLNLDVSSSVAVFALIPVVGILLGLWQIRNQLFSKSIPIKNLLGQFFSYSKWAFLNNVFAAGFPHIAIFMLAMISTSRTTGIYGLAHNLTYIFPILVVSLQSVLLPEVARLKNMAQIDKYIKSSLKIALYLTALVTPLLFFSGKIILFFFGLRYQGSVLIFNWLLLSHIFIVISIPIRSALYSMDKPSIISFVDLFRVTAMISGCYLLIPCLGFLVPAILAFIINVVALGFFILYIFRQIHREKPAHFFNNKYVEKNRNVSEL